MRRAIRIFFRRRLRKFFSKRVLLDTGASTAHNSTSWRKGGLPMKPAAPECLRKLFPGKTRDKMMLILSPWIVTIMKVLPMCPD